MTDKRSEVLKKRIEESFGRGETIFTNSHFNQERINALCNELKKTQRKKPTFFVRKPTVNYGIPQNYGVGPLTSIEVTYQGKDNLDFVIIRENYESGDLEVDAIGTELEDGVYFFRGRPLTLFKVPYVASENEMAIGIPKVEETSFGIYSGKLKISDDQLAILKKIMTASRRVASHAKQLVMKNKQNGRYKNKQQR